MGVKCLVVANTPSGADRSPLEATCARGCLPRKAADGLIVDWSEVTFCSISQLAAIACIQLAALQSGVEQHPRLPVGGARSYIERMDYCRILGISSKEHFSRHDPLDKFVPLAEIPIDEMRADPGNIADSLEAVVTKNTCLSKSASNMLNLSCLEVVDNVIQHSKASSPGLACAQYYPNLGYVEYCVADCGVGIPISMGENPLYEGMDNSNRMLTAFQRGTGQWFERSDIGTNKVSGGVGLSYAATLAEAMGGHVWAVSGDAGIHIHRGGRNSISGLWYPGTVVVVRIPNDSMEIKESDIFESGRSSPVFYEAGEGIWCDEDDSLW